MFPGFWRTGPFSGFAAAVIGRGPDATPLPAGRDRMFPAFAIDAFETCDHVGSLHPARQQTYSLGIPVTPAFEADAFDDISLNSISMDFEQVPCVL